MPESAPQQPIPFAESVKIRLESDPNMLGLVKDAEDIESVALDVLDNTSEGRELWQRIETARAAGKEDQDAIHERGKLWRTITIEMSLITGIEIEATDHEAQRDTYRNNLKGLLSTIDPEASDEEIMLKLGVIKPVEGKRGNVFTFPSRIFPPYVKEQWTAYTGMIEQFDDAKRKLEKGIITQEDFNAIDFMRTRAHDSVSNSIGEILELKDWRLEDYRRLAGKMRDEKFAEPKGEMAIYANLLRERVISPEHLTTVHRQLGKHGVVGSTKVDAES